MNSRNCSSDSALTAHLLARTDNRLPSRGCMENQTDYPERSRGSTDQESAIDETAVGVVAEQGVGELGQDLVELGVLLGRPAAELVLHPLALGVAELVGGQPAGLGDRQRAVGAPGDEAAIGQQLRRP